MRRGPGFYSQIVALLKVGLPLLALSLFAAVFLINQQDEFENGLTFSEADLDALGNGLRVTTPQLSGMTGAGHVYDFTASAAIPSDASLSSVSVRDLAGRIEMATGQTVTLSASIAELNFLSQKMSLVEGIRLQTSDGYLVEAQRIDADMKSATLIGEGPILATGPMGEISAGQMRIVPEGAAGTENMHNQVIWFEKGVKLVFVPAKGN